MVGTNQANLKVPHSSVWGAARFLAVTAAARSCIRESVAFRPHDRQEELPRLAVRHENAYVLGGAFRLESRHLFAAEGYPHHGGA